MTPLYRITGAESPELGHGTLWTEDPASAEWLARFESASRSLPAGPQLYRAEDPLTDEGWHDASDAWQRVLDGDLTTAELLRGVELAVARGCRWVQLTVLGRPPVEGGAMLYLGNGDLPAQPWKEA